MSDVIEKQQVIFSVEPNEDGTVEIGIEYEPALAGVSSKEYAGFTERDCELQGYAKYISSRVMESLKHEQQEG